jgi:hypothetical protein
MAMGRARPSPAIRSNHDERSDEMTSGWRAARSIALAAMLALGAGNAGAAMTYWQLQNVTMSDGTTVSGSLAYDDGPNMVTSWWIRVQGGSGLLPFTYVPANSVPVMAGSPLHLTADYVEFRSVEGGNGVAPRVLRLMPQWWFESTPTPPTMAIITIPEISGEGMGGTGARSVVAGQFRNVMLVPPVALVDVIEFYHAAFDHYFMSADPIEINALDTHYFTGWERTGYSFKAYVTGSYPGTTLRPVCRYYGLPSAGLDSHFYSADAAECFRVNRDYGTEWQIESDNVFQIALPDTTTGACPTGTTPVYRVFNHRHDANHRYTTSTTVRAQMEAAGWIREGYGPNATIMCAVGAP